MKVFAVIPSGGKGKRTGENTPKQYIRFNDRELISFTLQVFEDCERIDGIALAAEPEYFPLLEKIKLRDNISKLLYFAEAGKERQHSVYNALKVLPAADNDLVAVHDAARPLLPAGVLVNAITQAEKFNNIIVAIKAKDTLIKGIEKINDYLTRDEVFYVQTPQVFRYGTLVKAMEKAFSENFIGTDESMLVKRIAEEVRIVEGSSLNFKVTTASDIELFGLISKFL